jgi:hypothetical protein
MADQSLPATDGPGELLAQVRDLTHRVRVARRGTWFPLLVLALVVLGAIPVYRFPYRHVTGCAPTTDGHSVCRSFLPLAVAYWLVALLLAYIVIAAFYRRRAMRRGLASPIRPYVVAGAVIAVVLAAVTLWRVTHAGAASLTPPSHDFLYGLAGPQAGIGLALLVLAWAERSWAVLAFSVGYLAVVLVQGNQIIHSASPWYFLPLLLVPAAILLLGSAGFAVLQRTRSSLGAR